MPHTFAKIMFSEPSKQLQERFGSRAAYERMANSGISEQQLGADETEFIQARNSFYMASVTPDGWPYVQHRGGPTGFLHVLDPHTLAFADYTGNKQYISTGNLSVNDRTALFLMDYPRRTRLKIIAHAKIAELGEKPALEARLRQLDPLTKIERIMVLAVVGFDWNCNQHIEPRFTLEELNALDEMQPTGHARQTRADA